MISLKIQLRSQAFQFKGYTNIPVIQWSIYRSCYELLIFYGLMSVVKQIPHDWLEANFYPANKLTRKIVSSSNSASISFPVKLLHILPPCHSCHEWDWKTNKWLNASQRQMSGLPKTNVARLSVNFTLNKYFRWYFVTLHSHLASVRFRLARLTTRHLHDPRLFCRNPQEKRRRKALRATNVILCQ